MRRGQSPARSDKPVLVAVTTLGKRDLGSLLDAVEEQTELASLQVVILHNAPEKDEHLAEHVRRRGFEYVVVPRVGFAEVRNAALEQAARHHQYLLFIDDDEIPKPDWVRKHLTAARQWDADVVVGPVVAAKTEGAPAWSDAGRLIRPEAIEDDGPYQGHVGSGNTLLRVAFCREHGLTFDSRFNATGGEDTDFFLRARANGARTVWAQGCLVVERLDPDRLTLISLVRRSFRGGRVYARSFADRRFRHRAAFVIRKALQCLVGLLQIFAGTVRPVMLGRGVKTFANGLGALHGLLEAPLRQPRSIVSSQASD